LRADASALFITPLQECFIFVEKLALVLAMRMLPSITAKAVAQAAVYASFAILQMYLWPFQSLDARIPLVVWVPWLPARYRVEMRSDEDITAGTAQGSAAAAAALSAARHLPGWRATRRGWQWRSHFFVADALNYSTLSANLVPLLNIIITIGASGRGVDVLNIFLIGLNCMKIVFTLAAWISFVAIWQLQSRELVNLDRVRAAQRAAAKARALTGEPDPEDEKNVRLARASFPNMPRFGAKSADTDAVQDVDGFAAEITPAPQPARTATAPMRAATAAVSSDGVDGWSFDDAAAPSAAPSARSGKHSPATAAAVWAPTAEVDGVAGWSDEAAAAFASTPAPHEYQAQQSFGAGVDMNADRVGYTEAEELAALEALGEAGAFKKEKVSLWATFRAATGLGRAALVMERTPEEVRDVIIAGGAKMHVLALTGRINKCRALRTTVTAVTSATLARMQLRHAALVKLGPEAEHLAAAMEAEIAQIERLFMEHGFEELHFRTQDQREADDTESFGMQRLRELPGIRSGPVLAAALVVLVAVALGLGLGTTIDFSPDPPPPPSPPPSPPLAPFPPPFSPPSTVSISSLTLSGINPATFDLAATTAALTKVRTDHAHACASAYQRAIPFVFHPGHGRVRRLCRRAH
jgi:hypothetical protein